MEEGEMEGEEEAKSTRRSEERGPTVRIGPFPSFLIAVDELLLVALRDIAPAQWVRGFLQLWSEWNG